MRFSKNKLLWFISKKIKANPRLYRIIYPIRARQIKKLYRDTVSYYNKRTNQGSFRELLDSRAREKLDKLRRLNRKLNILYIGTDYLQDSGGMLQALAKIGNLSTFTRENGEYGQYLSGVLHHQHDLGNESKLDLKELNGNRLLQIISELNVKNQVPDIIIGQMWAGWAPGNILSEIREQFGIIVVNICMDDRHSYWGELQRGGLTGTYGLIPHIDLAVTSAPECVDWYLKEGCPAVFFPEASDPEIFHQMPGLPKIHDVSFVGMCYGIRREIVMRLRKAGIRVAAYGGGWENGRIATEDVPKLFAQSKIILGVGTISHCRDFYALKMRDFDGPMSGSLYITHDNRDLYRLYEVGNEILVYRSIGDCISKIEYYLKHNEEREAIAYRGYRKALENHTWEKRFMDLIKVLLNEA